VIDTKLPDTFHDMMYTYSNGKEISRFVKRRKEGIQVGRERKSGEILIHFCRFTNNPGNNVLPVIPSLE
jgi:hypothetical protein